MTRLWTQSCTEGIRFGDMPSGRATDLLPAAPSRETTSSLKPRACSVVLRRRTKLNSRASDGAERGWTATVERASISARGRPANALQLCTPPAFTAPLHIGWEWPQKRHVATNPPWRQCLADHHPGQFQNGQSGRCLPVQSVRLPSTQPRPALLDFSS